MAAASSRRAAEMAILMALTESTVAFDAHGDDDVICALAEIM